MSIQFSDGTVRAASAPDPGAIPGTDTTVVAGIEFGTITEGGGNGNAPSITVSLSYADDFLSQIQSVRVELRAPDGEIISQSAQADDNEDLTRLDLGLRSQSISGEYSLNKIVIQFAGDPAVTGLPENGLTIEANELSSLIDSRFVTLENPDQDITPPEISDILLPVRSILVDNDLPGGLGGGDSAEITFEATITDDNSGLNVIEFEFDIGPGFAAVIGAEVGIFGDLDEGPQQLSAFNTESPAGRYVFELFRVSDDQGNTVIYTADDLAGLGFQNAIQVVTPEDLQDATSPDVESIELSSNSVVVDADGGTLDVSFVATDEGVGATGVQTLTLVLTSELGSRYELVAEAIMGDGDAGSATFSFPRDFPAGTFTIERLSVNDAAFNREDVSLSDTTLIVENSEGGDIAANRLRGDDTDNVIVARAGNDTVVGGLGADYLLLGDGNDIAFGGTGDLGDDTVIGGAGSDVLAGGGGNDFLIGGQLITLDSQTLLLRDLETRLDGSDTVFGGDGDDTIFGGSPRFDTVDGVPTIQDYGSTAQDLIFAGQGDDWVMASFGSDTVGGGSGADTLLGGAGHDVFYGGKGDAGAAGINDLIKGEDGNDAVFASGGNDSVSGGADNDTLFGGDGNDTLTGDGGHDEIFGGTGDDMLSGGSGRDIFYFGPGNGADVVTDYDGSEDTIFLSQFSDRFGSLNEILANATVLTLNGQSGLMLDLGEGDQVFFHDLTSFSQLNIVF